MVAAQYTPDKGHVVWLRHSPQAGHEQPGRRPALVLSPESYNGKTGLAVFCPITSKIKGYPFEVTLPAASAVNGVILADQVRSLDWRSRQARFIEKVPLQTVAEVRGKLAVLLERGRSERTMDAPAHMGNLLDAMNDFLTWFHLVFDYDWDMTKDCLKDPEHLIKGTFIDPLVGDESNNWSNRGSLLASYRELLECMERLGVLRKPPF